MCMRLCVQLNSPTAHTTGLIMSKPDMKLVSDLGMVHNLLAKSRARHRFLLILNIFVLTVFMLIN